MLPAARLLLSVNSCRFDGVLVNGRRRMPAAQIVAMGVLPKGQTWPNTCTEAITAANQRLQECSDRHKPWLHYVDVGDRFLTHQVCAQT